MKVLVPGINNVTNKSYHSDKNWLSSSSLKKLLKSPAQFYKELTEPQPESDNVNFLEGSYTHSLILEPEKIEEEYAVFEGIRKQGKEFEQFKEEHSDKSILSKPQRSRCLAYKRAYDANSHAVELIAGGEPEHTICGKILDVPIKVRFDYLNVAGGYGVDIKTSSFPVDRESFARTCFQYGYGLSAALYLTLAEDYYKKKLDFYFIAIAKQELDCQVFRLSKETRMRGEADMIKALKIYKQCIETGVWPVSIEPDSKTVSDEIEEI